MEEIIKALCRTWREKWQGMVMGELKYRRGRREPSGRYDISFAGNRIIKISAFDQVGGERMDILLFPFSTPVKSEPAAGDKGIFWRIFRNDEIGKCSRSLGDHNNIHQMQHPVVSGFQIALELQKQWKAEAFRIRFHYPVYGEEAVYIREKGNTLYGTTQFLCFEAVRQ